VARHDGGANDFNRGKNGHKETTGSRAMTPSRYGNKRWGPLETKIQVNL